MEKLIELLNEYQYGMFVYENEQLRFRMGSKVKIGAEPILISKSFGFIKWLVENDKIEREQKTKEFRLQIELDNGSYGELGGEARLLMLLSISDTPIDDLISYLK